MRKHSTIFSTTWSIGCEWNHRIMDVKQNQKVMGLESVQMTNLPLTRMMTNLPFQMDTLLQSACQMENYTALSCLIMPANLNAIFFTMAMTSLPHQSTACSKDHQNRSLPDLPQVTLWPCTTERCFCIFANHMEWSR